MKNYPSFLPANELAYKIGSYHHIVPPFLADTMMIRPFGEYGLDPAAFGTRLNGGYLVNAQSAVTASPNPGGTDLTYLINHDLKLLPGVKKVVIAVHWYTSIDQGNVANNQIVPAIGPEVQAWNWNTPPPNEYLVNPWTRANAYYLKPTHQLWPTLDDNSFFSGVEYLQSQGYEVGICPIATAMSANYYFSGGGEWEVDRTLIKWVLSNQTAFTNYLDSYYAFYRHYIDLFSQGDIRPWIFYLGYGMRDITGCGVPAFLVQFVQKLRDLAAYCKAKLPNTLTTYAADLDEYYYPYLVNSDFNNLDPLWTCDYLDYIGINWFAPLVIDDTEDNQLLEQGVCQGEGDTFFFSGFNWRASTTDRLISSTTQNFKTGLTKSAVIPLVNGVKEIIDWLSFYHYYPAINGVLAGCTPLPNMFPGDRRLCSHIHGNGITGSVKVLYPQTGGIAPVPKLPDTWVQVLLHSYMYLTFPVTIPDQSVFKFEFNFSLDPTQTDLTGNQRLTDSSYGLKIDSLAGTITLWLPTLAGSFKQVPLFFDPKGDISLVYTATSVAITIDGAYDFTITPDPGSLFKLPGPLDTMWLGNPQTAGMLPAGYSPWQGKIYFLSLILGVEDNRSGGQFYFDDAYCGIRTAWEPSLKPWMATSFGYGSIRGSAADPQTRVQTILSSGTSVLPLWYEDYLNVSTAHYARNNTVWNIQGPYGSDFAIDDVYQAIVMNAAALGIINAGAIHLVAWYVDTRSGPAYLALTGDGKQQIFNDAYDYEINAVLNGKSAIQDGGNSMLYVPQTTVSEDLGLSIVPGPLPYERVILVQPGVPQV